MRIVAVAISEAYPEGMFLLTDKQAYLAYRAKTGLAAPFVTVDWNSHGIYDYTEPVVGVNQKHTDALVDNGSGGKTWQVVDLTVQEIADALVVYKTQKLSQVRIESNIHIESTYPIWYQSNVALGIYAEGTMVTDIESVIAESNRVEDAIDAAVDKAGVDTAYATINWPTIGA